MRREKKRDKITEALSMFNLAISSEWPKFSLSSKYIADGHAQTHTDKEKNRSNSDSIHHMLKKKRRNKKKQNKHTQCIWAMCDAVIRLHHIDFTCRNG